MIMTDERSANVDQLHEELTAYLDGELNVEAVRQVEDRLARDPDYRHELQRLEKAWNLLDRLPRSTVDESFTKTTIEMVAVAAADEAGVIESMRPKRLRQQRVAAMGGVLAAGLVGFVVGQFVWQSPNDQLLQDLPVLENFDLYYQADNLELLRLLEKEGLFSEADDHAP
jgi:anti-sigma factor RsiW